MTFKFERLWKEYTQFCITPCVVWDGEDKEIFFAWLTFCLSVKFGSHDES